MDAFLAFATSGAQVVSWAGMNATAADQIVVIALFLCGVSLAAAVVTGSIVLALTMSARRRREEC